MKSTGKCTSSRFRNSAGAMTFYSLIFAFLPLQAQFVNNHGVFGSGGIKSGSEIFVLNSTVGQSLAGVSGNAASTLSSGFWHIISSNSVSTSISREKVELPPEFRLFQNYPNPFNPTTIIRFDLPEESPVSIDIYNITGQRVLRLLNETRPAGTHAISLDAGRLTSGVYLYKIVAGSQSSTGKMMLIK